MLPPIYSTLTAASAVTAIVGDRIYPHGEAPQGALHPYVTWQTISGVPQITLSDAPDIDQISIQIDCWHRSSTGIVQLASAVRQAIEVQAHVTNAVMSGREPDTRLYRAMIELDYWLDR